MKLWQCSLINRTPKPTDDPAYLEWIATQPCIVCGWKAEPHHAGPRGLSQRSSDREALPFCRRHHRRVGLGGGPDSVHVLGKRFWQFHGIDRIEAIQEHNARYEREERKAA